MQTSEQLCTRKQNTMDEYPKIKNFPLKRRNWQSSNLVIELASCFLFPCWSRVSLVRFIRYRLETAKKSPAPENKSCQAQYRNLLSVVMCARFTFELWILIFLFCSSTIRAASYSNRFDTIFPPFFYPSANQLNLSILCVNFRSKRLWIFGRQLWVASGFDLTNITWFIGHEKLVRKLVPMEGEKNWSRKLNSFF